jgi:hypothetical protein
MSKPYFTGLNEVLRNLNKEVAALKQRTVAGLWEAGLEVKRRSIELTPRKTGNLRASHYTIAYESSSGPTVEIGLTAAYAPFVHERLELKHPIGQAKFLETALQETPIIEILERAAKESM